MNMNKKLTIAAGSVAALLLFFVVAILPGIVRNKAVMALQDATGRAVSIGAVSINPFSLTVTVRDLTVAENAPTPLLKLAGLRASLSASSLFRRSFILDELTIDTPVVSVVRLASNRYSFSDIITRSAARPKQPGGGSPLYSLNNIRIINGSIDFDDQAVSGGRKHTIRNLDVAIPFISNIPYLVESYVDPKFSAEIDGAHLSFTGKTKPLSSSMETSLQIELQRLKLAPLLAYAPTPLPVALTSGDISINAELNYRASRQTKPDLTLKGIIRLDGLAVTQAGGQEMLKIPTLQVKAARIAPFARQFLIDSIALEGAELFVSRNARGEWAHQRLFSSRDTAHVTPDKKPAPPPAPPHLQIGSFTVANSTLHLKDTSVPGGFSETVSEIDATVTGFSTAPGTPASFELSLTADSAATLAAEGTFSSVDKNARCSFELAGLTLQRGWPYLARFLTAPVQGTLDLAGQVSYAPDQGVELTRASLGGRGLAARYGEREGISLDRFDIGDVSYRQKQNLLDVGEIRLNRGTISLSRETDGSLSLQSLLKKPQTAAARAPQPRSPARAEVRPEFSYRVKKIAVDRLSATLTDKARPERPRFSLTNTSIGLARLQGPRFTPAPLTFSTTFNKATPVKASGQITPSPFRYQGTVAIGRLPLRDFEAYFPSNLNVFVQAGTADTGMTVDIGITNGKPVGSFKGTAGIRGFHAIDTKAEEDLLSWESLQFDEIGGTLDPFSLSLRQIALNSVYSRIIIRKDGSLNLQNLVEKQAAPSPASGNSAVPADTPQARPAPKQPRHRSGSTTSPSRTARCHLPTTICRNSSPPHFTIWEAGSAA